MKCAEFVFCKLLVSQGTNTEVQGETHHLGISTKFIYFFNLTICQIKEFKF